MAWRKALHDGLVEGSALPGEDGRKVAELRRSDPRPDGRPNRWPARSSSAPIPPSGTARYANNGWLQELAEAAHQADLGQRRADRAGDGAEARRGDRGRRRAHARRPQGRGARLGHAGTGRGLRHRPLRLRPHARRPRRRRRGLRRVRAARERGALGARRASRSRRRCGAPRSRRRSTTTAWKDATSSAPSRPRSTARTRGRREDGRAAAGPEGHALPDAADRQLRLGPLDRPVDLRRLQRVRHRLPVGEQHPGRRQGRGRARPRDAVDPHRPLLQGRPRQPRDRPPAGDLHALRERAVRDRSARSPRPSTAPKA